MDKLRDLLKEKREFEEELNRINQEISMLESKRSDINFSIVIISGKIREEEKISLKDTGREFVFEVNFPKEMTAGFYPYNYNDQVTVSFESGNVGGDDEGMEFVEFMRMAIKEWFDGADVKYIKK